MGKIRKILVRNKNNENKSQNRGKILTTPLFKKKNSILLLNNNFFIVINQLSYIIKVFNIVLSILF